MPRLRSVGEYHKISKTKLFFIFFTPISVFYTLEQNKRSDWNPAEPYRAPQVQN